MNQKRLPTPKKTATANELMSAPGQVLPGCGNRRFKPHSRDAILVAPPRSIEGILQVHAEVNHITKELDLALRLNITTNKAESDKGFLGMQHHCRNDRMARPLVWRDRVWMSRIKRET